MAQGAAMRACRRIGLLSVAGPDAGRQRAFRRRLRCGIRKRLGRRRGPSGRRCGISARRRAWLGHPVRGGLGALLYCRLYFPGVQFWSKSLFHALCGRRRHSADRLSRKFFTLRRARDGILSSCAGNGSRLRLLVLLSFCPAAGRGFVGERRDTAQRVLYGARRQRADEPRSAASIRSALNRARACADRAAVFLAQGRDAHGRRGGDRARNRHGSCLRLFGLFCNDLRLLRTSRRRVQPPQPPCFHALLRTRRSAFRRGRLGPAFLRRSAVRDLCRLCAFHPAAGPAR